MSLLIFFILLSIGVSFLCSMLEAIILSVTPSYLVSLKDHKPVLYQRVKNLKKDIEKPLASILTFNTVAHTVGAAGAGAEAQRLFGSEVLAVFSALLTFAILFFSEIIPKSLGAGSWKSLLPFATRLLGPMMIISYPIVWMSKKFSSLFKREKEVISRAEIKAMADIGLRDGTLAEGEHRMMTGLIRFQQVQIDEIITPKGKVVGLNMDLSIDEAYQEIQKHRFSRIMLFSENMEKVRHYLLRSSLQQIYIDQESKTLRDIKKNLLVLPQNTSLPHLFQKLLERREHVSAIEDEKGMFLGIITLEDLIEHMLDLEIYDEFDLV